MSTTNRKTKYKKTQPQAEQASVKYAREQKKKKRINMLQEADAQKECSPCLKYEEEQKRRRRNNVQYFPLMNWKIGKRPNYTNIQTYHSKKKKEFIDVEAVELNNEHPLENVNKIKLEIEVIEEVTSEYKLEEEIQIKKENEMDVNVTNAHITLEEGIQIKKEIEIDREVTSEHQLEVEIEIKQENEVDVDVINADVLNGRNDTNKIKH